MASLTDRSNSERHYGDSSNSIAEKIWGRGAWVRRTSTLGEGCYLGEVVARAGKSGVQTVLANVVIRPDDQPSA